MLVLVLLVLPAGCGSEPSGNDQVERQKDDKPPAKAQTADPSQMKKGTGYGGDPVSEPIRVRFWAEHKLKFDLVKKLVREHNIVHGPLKSHPEFMQKIIAANDINLPEPKAGLQYQFNVKEQKLDVRPSQ